MSAAEAHLDIQGVVKRYGAETILAGVDLAAARGELLTLLGPSGCGKTTLLRIVAGFLRPEAGAVALAGRALGPVPPERRNIGMVFQSYAVFPHLSVADNVGYGLAARGVRGAEAARRIEAALARVRLAGFGARFPDALSGGQKQRVGLARAMVIAPDLLLMDEPLSNLDAKLRVEMRAEIRRMQRELGITTLYVTHDQEEALAISDRIAVMEKGRILQLDPPRAVFERPAHAFVAEFLGGCNWFEAALAAGPGGDELRLDAGPVLALPGAGGKAGGRAPGRVRVAARAEELRLAAPGEAALEGRVDMLAFLGHRTRLTLAVPGLPAPVEADLPSGAALPAEGAMARLALDPARLALFDAADGRRLP